MKRTAVLKKLRKAAKAAGVEYREVELTRHTGIFVGSVRTTLGRHSEVDEQTVESFYKQLESELGKRWWR